MNNKIEIQFFDNSYGVYSKVNLVKDEIIFTLENYRIIDKPTRFTVQIDIDKHIDLPENIDIPAQPEQFWRYLNHSCKPNCYCNTKDLTFRAKYDIKQGEHITFNYHTTEYNMAYPFKCNCKSEKCVGWIKGFKHLNDKKKKEILPYTAKHILKLYVNNKIFE
jgi:hypothetical protein